MVRGLSLNIALFEPVPAEPAVNSRGKASLVSTNANGAWDLGTWGLSKSREESLSLLSLSEMSLRPPCHKRRPTWRQDLRRCFKKIFGATSVCTCRVYTYVHTTASWPWHCLVHLASRFRPIPPPPSLVARPIVPLSMSLHTRSSVSKDSKALAVTSSGIL